MKITWGYSTKKTKRPRSLSDKKQDDNDHSSLDLDNIMDIFGKKSKVNDNNFYTMNNNIYFQDEISMETADSLKKELRNLENFILNMTRQYKLDSPPPIKLHITSGGGSVVAAFSIIDCMEELSIPVHTIVDGYAASAATLISVCGSKRYIKKNATMLIHEVRSEMWGKMSEIEDEYLNLKRMHERIKSIYIEKTNLQRKDLLKILKHDIDWDAEECLAKGLVDEIL